MGGVEKAAGAVPRATLLVFDPLWVSSELPNAERKGMVNLRGGIIAYANAGGRLVEPSSRAATNQVHGYKEYWQLAVKPPNIATLLPPIPKSTT